MDEISIEDLQRFAAENKEALLKWKTHNIHSKTQKGPNNQGTVRSNSSIAGHFGKELHIVKKLTFSNFKFQIENFNFR